MSESLQSRTRWPNSTSPQVSLRLQKKAAGRGSSGEPAHIAPRPGYHPDSTADVQSGASRHAGPFFRVHPLARPIGGRAALAFPNHVPPTGARDIEDEKVSGQQPVTTWTALGWSIHPLPVSAAHPLANLSSHTDHISSAYLGNPRAVRKL